MEGSPNDPRRIEISAPISAVRFPALCASCAATPPAGALPRVRLFRRTYHDSESGSSTRYVFAQVRVPFCAACLARHEHDRQPVDEGALRSLRLKWMLKVLPFVFPIGIILFLLSKVVPIALREVPRADWRVGGGWQTWLLLGIVAFFAFCLFAFGWMAINVARPLIMHARGGDPNATDVVIVPGMLGSEYVVPMPPTPTLAAVTFEDEQYMIFEANKRAFTFENPIVAQQFAALNADLVWTPDAPHAVRGFRMRYAAIVGVIVVGGAYVAWELLLG